LKIGDLKFATTSDILLFPVIARNEAMTMTKYPNSYKNLINMFNKLKQFKDLRDQAKQMQNALSTESAEGSGAWGKVKITMNGNMEITKIDIDDELMGNKEKLASAIKDAHKEAMKRVQKIMAKKMQDMGGLSGFPGMG